MYKRLFILCPTDCLESIINDTFKHDNFFYTSLGNSFTSDNETIEYIKRLVIKHNIRRIYFVLSNDNQIIFDALGGQFFSEIRELKKFYCEISRQKEDSKVLWSRKNSQFSILSYYMNKKISELRLELNNSLNHSFEVNGLVYNKDVKAFEDIYPDLFCIKKYQIN